MAVSICKWAACAAGSVSAGILRSRVSRLLREAGSWKRAVRHAQHAWQQPHDAVLQPVARC